MANISAEISKLREDLSKEVSKLREDLLQQMHRIELKMELHDDGLAMLRTQQAAQAAGVGTGEYVPESRGFGPIPGSSLSPRSRWGRTWFYGH